MKSFILCLFTAVHVNSIVPSKPEQMDNGFEDMDSVNSNYWWCNSSSYRDGTTGMEQMVAFIGNESNYATITIQKQDMTYHHVSLPKKYDGTNAQFPYIAYNPGWAAFEVVGSFNSNRLQVKQNGNGHGSYHFTVDFWNATRNISAISNYDGRNIAGFLYVPEVNDTIFVGGFGYGDVKRVLIYSVEKNNRAFTLPSKWPDSYWHRYPNLVFPQVTYHEQNLYVVGGNPGYVVDYGTIDCVTSTDYPNAQEDMSDKVWSLTFDWSYANTGKELEWNVLTGLSSNYGACRGVMAYYDWSYHNALIMTTVNSNVSNDGTLTSQGFEAKYNANETVVNSSTAFSYGNDMPIQFFTLPSINNDYTGSWNVMGGSLRGSDGFIESIVQWEESKGFQQRPMPDNFKFPLLGIQLLGTEISNKYPAPYQTCG